MKKQFSFPTFLRESDQASKKLFVSSRLKKLLRRLGILLLLAGVCFNMGCDSCDCEPREAFFAFIGYWDFPSGETFTTTNNSPYQDNTVDFIARVYYPSYDESVLDDLENPNFEGIEVADGKHPLIIFGHGRYGGGVPTNYLGMTNLMNHLASWGYICVSINFDVFHQLQSSYSWGIPHRGELFLHAIYRMAQLNTDTSSIFYDKIDTSKIALIGHSRGGGGAISAVNQNLSQGSPRTIVALATLSPVDFGTDALQAAIPHISLYGTWDGDLLDGEGPRIWDEGVRTAHKEFVEIYGANHFNFTDDIDYINEVEEIPREDQKEIAQGFINAYFDVYGRGNDRWDWPKYLTGHVRMLQNVDYYIQYLSSDFLTIDNGNPLGTVNTNNLGGNNNGSSLTLFDDEMLDDYNQYFYNMSEGLLIHWNDIGDQLGFDFPAQDVSNYTHLHFRTSQRPGNTLNVLDTFKNFRVKVQDSDGGVATVSIKDYFGGIQYPDYSNSLTATWQQPYQYKSIPRSFRIPFTDLQGVDSTKINQVVLLFDRPDETGYKNITGAIALDDLEFTE